MNTGSILALVLVLTATAAAVEPVSGAAKNVEEQDRFLRLQVFLDDAGFRPGVIDGRWGEFTGKALARYQQSQGKEKPVFGAQSPAEFAVPFDQNRSPLTTYRITEADEKEVGPVRERPEQQQKLKELAYGSVVEVVAEKFHAKVELLKQLNPNAAWTAQETVQVPAVAVPFDLQTVAKLKTAQAKRKGKADPAGSTDLAIVIDTSEEILELLSAGKVIGSYPVTAGSEQLPAPQGEWVIERITWLPPFRWDKAMLMKGERSANAFNLPPGPNSPVGILWMQLNKKGIGIHGTNEPETIGRSVSHGCIRLSNWDALDLGQKVSPKTIVTIR